MKIAMYSTSELFGTRVTGGLKRFLELYYGLIENGYDVDLYSLDSQESLKRNNIKGYSLNKIGGAKKVFIPEELKIMYKNIGILRTIKEKRYSKVIIFDVPTAFSLTIMGIKNIQLFIRQDLIGYKRISLQNRVSNEYFIKFYLKILKIIEYLCLIRAEKIIVQCEYDLNLLTKRHKTIKNKIYERTRVQINNVNPKWIQASSLDNDNRSTNLIDKNKFVIAFIGDFSNDRKGQRLFLDAMKSLINRKINVAAILMGDGKQLDDYVSECKPYNDIKFLGRVSNPDRIIKYCDLVVAPSLADSCPNTIMESLYNEVPVIGAATGGIPEILLNPDYLFDPKPKDLEERIIMLLNPQAKEKIQNEQKSRKAELSFNWAEKIISILEI